MEVATAYEGSEQFKQRIINSLTPQGQKNLVAAFVAQIMITAQAAAPESAQFIRDLLDKDDFHALLQFAAHSEMTKEILFGKPFDPTLYERGEGVAQELPDN